MWAFASVGQWAVAIAVAREKTCTSRAVGSCYRWSKEEIMNRLGSGQVLLVE
jgi:hypothetical protein